VIELQHLVGFVVVVVAADGVVRICCLTFGLDMGLVLVAC
jgi:hypothetical protein